MALLIHSREYGDGSEYTNVGSNHSISDSNDIDIIPSHYVKRLWRKPTLEIPTFAIGKNSNSASSSALTRYKTQYINKTPNSSDRSVQFSIVQDGQGFVLRHGDSDRGEEIAKLRWSQGSNPAGDILLPERIVEKGSITLGTKTMPVKDFMKKPGLIGAFSQSRVFTGPDGIEYKWKLVFCGNNPVYPDATYRELYFKNSSSGDSKFPIATTQRLTSRDGFLKDETHPLYISQHGLGILPFIISTLAILDRVDNM
ncbi:hypothetical protein D9758_016128 [Tetrapyrgos nigripes]|uniref:DUF6593 domain-containing protein n=1 Tax=Tetrapyrgos nigripes TaxID=182062 RepID=A0A8H5FDA2_9AGAR|nr:hypothetical protein D9758_016128 [Tetrapyrgos nigripes]